MSEETKLKALREFAILRRDVCIEESRRRDMDREYRVSNWGGMIETKKILAEIDRLMKDDEK